MEIFHYHIGYRPKGDTETRGFGARISAHNWWAAMGVVTSHILPTLDADKVYSIRIYQED